MDIDDRLERLTQRHEALTQTVELLTKDLSDIKVLVNDIAEGTARLLHVAEIHEKRSSRLEDEKL
jgi:archaellum component FlaC